MQTLTYKLWLVLGVTQIVLIAGCNGATASSDGLFSNDPEAAHAGSDASKKIELPARLSRAFFERSLTGSVAIGQDVAQSDVSWAELPPTAPPPSGPVIADFRDHQGCASYDDSGVQLCFNIMPDVSSVALSAKDVHAQGLCDALRFVKAWNTGGIVTVQFEGTCENQAQTVVFTLRQV